MSTDDDWTPAKECAVASVVHEWAEPFPGSRFSQADGEVVLQVSPGEILDLARRAYAAGGTG